MKNSINTYFDKIYLLTIERNLNRQSLFAKNLEGIDYTIFIGADGKQLDLEALEKGGEYDSESMSVNTYRLMKNYLGISYLGEPHINMVACSISHRNIYKDIIKNNYNKVLILEDDSLIQKTSLVYWESIIKQLPNDWDLLYLGYEWKYDKSPVDFFKRVAVYPFLNSMKIKKYNLDFIRNGYAKSYTENLFRSGTHAGTHAYAITKRCAEILIEEQSPISYNPDLLFWEPIVQGRINAFSCKPKLFITADISSSIMEG